MKVIRKKLESQFEMHEDVDELAKEEFSTNMDGEIRGIPFKSVPETQSDRRELQPVDIENEVSCKAGKFGWCIVCRKEAHLYCKHTRHPVCSYECKE